MRFIPGITLAGTLALLPCHFAHALGAGGYNIRNDKFSLLESGNFRLSETPELPGKGWHAELPRICSRAKLRKSAGSGNLCVFNPHLDHCGIQARLESAKPIIGRIKDIARDEDCRA